MSNINYGANQGFMISQTGANSSISGISQGTTTDPQALFREMLAAVQTLRGQVGPMNQQAIDESLAELGNGENVPKQRMHGALTRIGGIASFVGQVGAPVVEAIRKVMAAFGLA